MLNMQSIPELKDLEEKMNDTTTLNIYYFENVNAKKIVSLQL
jgi:hypothetical protein